MALEPTAPVAASSALATGEAAAPTSGGQATGEASAPETAAAPAVAAGTQAEAPPHPETPGTSAQVSAILAAAGATPARGLRAAEPEDALANTPRPVREFKPESRPRPFEVPQDVEFNGDLLRQVRMARGLSLVQLSERTRISTRHLENVEGDRYDQLPATVYLRGILVSLARELGLDGLRVAKSYLAFVEALRSKG